MPILIFLNYVIQRAYVAEKHCGILAVDFESLQRFTCGNKYPVSIFVAYVNRKYGCLEIKSGWEVRILILYVVYYERIILKC